MTDQERVRQRFDAYQANDSTRMREDWLKLETLCALLDLRDHLRQAFSAELPTFKIQEKTKLP